MAFRAQKPFSEADSIQARSFGRIAGRSMNRCFVSLITGVVEQTLHRGLISSMGSRSFPQFSHWSPRASG